MAESWTDSLQLPSQMVSLIAAILFISETYHFIGHASVLFRIRLLPRKDLVRVRYYFLMDTVSVCITVFLFTGQLRVLAALQFLQHMFFFLTWNKNAYTNKVISWSSLDWQKSPNRKYWEWDVILGTAYDTFIHAANSYILATYLSTGGILVSMAVCQIAALFILFNPRFAWSNPKSIPAWVLKRIRPVKEGRCGVNPDVKTN